MAIDTAVKRKSAINVGLLFLRLGVVPDGGGLETGQRLHTQGLYSGIGGLPIFISTERMGFALYDERLAFALHNGRLAFTLGAERNILSF